jgi:hypothetical protein
VSRLRLNPNVGVMTPPGPCQNAADIDPGFTSVTLEITLGGSYEDCTSSGGGSYTWTRAKAILPTEDNPYPVPAPGTFWAQGACCGPAGCPQLTFYNDAAGFLIAPAVVLDGTNTDTCPYCTATMAIAANFVLSMQQAEDGSCQFMFASGAVASPPFSSSPGVCATNGFYSWGYLTGSETDWMSLADFVAVHEFSGPYQGDLSFDLKVTVAR